VICMRPFGRKVIPGEVMESDDFNCVGVVFSLSGSILI